MWCSISRPDRGCRRYRSEVESVSAVADDLGDTLHDSGAAGGKRVDSLARYIPLSVSFGMIWDGGRLSFTSRLATARFPLIIAEFLEAPVSPSPQELSPCGAVHALTVCFLWGSVSVQTYLREGRPAGTLVSTAPVVPDRALFYGRIRRLRLHWASLFPR